MLGLFRRCRSVRISSGHCRSRLLMLNYRFFDRHWLWRSFRLLTILSLIVAEQWLTLTTTHLTINMVILLGS